MGLARSGCIRAFVEPTTSVHELVKAFQRHLSVGKYLQTVINSEIVAILTHEMCNYGKSHHDSLLWRLNVRDIKNDNHLSCINGSLYPFNELSILHR